MDGPWDIVVMGAGAAGLMAALRAAELGRRTLLLEKNRKAGVKILMSGGTRCNITHATDNRGIVEAFGHPGRILHSALAALSVQDTIELFDSAGVPTKVESTGKIFPVSNKALDVLTALLRRLENSGATLALQEPVLDVRADDFGFVVTTPRRAVRTRRVILTTGGRSYPGSGTTGDGYEIAARFGHTIVSTRPALVPLRVTVPWVNDLRGVTLPDVAVRIVEGPTPRAHRRGSLLFAHFGLSGPVILDLSRIVTGHPQPLALTLEMDLLPNVRESETDDLLRRESAAAGKKQLAVVLANPIPRRLAEAVLAVAGLPADRKAAALSREDRLKLARAMHQLPVPLAGALGFEKAEVTAGGIALAEVDSRDMQSRRQPGLFVAGEVLDLDGPIGGYNFQAAWSTGWLAGTAAAES